jgi:hypothetical protein
MQVTQMFRAVDFETITVNTTAIGFTSTKIDSFDGGQIVVAFCTVEDAPIRVIFNTGTTVNATTNGHQYSAGDFFNVWHPNLPQFRMIRSGSANGKLKVSYFQA